MNTNEEARGGVPETEKNIGVEVIAASGETMLDHLGKGEMLVAATQEELLFVLDAGSRYEIFTHIPGTPEGQHKTLAKSDQSDALIRSLSKLADEMYAVSFDKRFDLNGVLVAAEQAVLSRRPPAEIEFFIPGQEEK